MNSWDDFTSRQSERFRKRKYKTCIRELVTVKPKIVNTDNHLEYAHSERGYGWKRDVNHTYCHNNSVLSKNFSSLIEHFSSFVIGGGS